jgi:hypothetical protein
VDKCEKGILIRNKKDKKLYTGGLLMIFLNIMLINDTLKKENISYIN